MNFKRIMHVFAVFAAILSIGAGLAFLFITNDAPKEEQYQLVSQNGKEEPYDRGDKDYTPAMKAETVYVMLSHDGEVKNKVIVNRIYGGLDSSAPLVADYGRYISVENMVSADEPLIEKNRLLWSSSLLSDQALYYEGALDKNLPLEIHIEYFLDGEKIDAGKLAGKSGYLEILVRAKNRLRYDSPVSYIDYYGNRAAVDDVNYVPFLVQGALDLDLERYSNIESGEGSEIVIGSKASVNFLIFPYPEDEITISMNGRNIELEKISFVIEPRLMPLPEVEVEEDLLKLLSGFKELREGIAALSSGSDQLLRALRLLQAESGRFTEGTAELGLYLDKYRELREKFIPLTSSPKLQETLQRLDELQALLNNLEKIPHPDCLVDDIRAVKRKISELELQIDSVNVCMNSIQDRSPAIRAEAEKLVAENEPGSELHALGQIILKQEKELEKLSAENEQLNQNLGELRNVFNTLNSNWENCFVPGLQALETIGIYLGSGDLCISDEIDRIVRILTNNLHCLEDLDRIILEAEKLLREGAALPGTISQLAAGQEQLNAGLKELQESGFSALEKGLIEGINKSRFAAAKLELMEQLADDYRSFADNENNRYSEVQFIMQTSEIKVFEDGEITMDVPVKDEKQNWPIKLWTRLINLFL